MDKVPLENTIENGKITGVIPVLYRGDYTPTVSVVTPTFQRDHLFDIAIFNWKNFIYQEDKIEWIILDDSPHEYRKRLKKKLPSDSRIKYYTCKKIDTIGKKRNKINELANHEIIVHMDDDDYYPPDSVMNRVFSLLTYKKKCVGTCSVNCINLLDDTCFKTGGGLINDTIITAEASLAYYKSFWKEQGYSDSVKNEECKEFLLNRHEEYIDLNSAFNMLAITHSKNMSNRTIINSINKINFKDSLPVNVVNILDKLQIVIHSGLPGMSEAKDFVRSMHNKEPVYILEKMKKLPVEIRSTTLISAYQEQILPEEEIIPGSITVIYFPGIINRTVEKLSPNYIDYKSLQLIKFIERNYPNRDITIYCRTMTEFKIGTITLKSWFDFNKKRATDIFIVVDDYSLLTSENKYNKLIYLNIRNTYNEDYPNDALTKVDEYNEFINTPYICSHSTPIQYVKKNNNVKKDSIYNDIKFFYLGNCEELKNNYLYIYDNCVDDDILSVLHTIYDGIFSTHCLNNKMKHVNRPNMCEYVLFSSVLNCDIGFLCYLIKYGIKYFVVEETTESTALGILNYKDQLPDNYYETLGDRLQKFTQPC